MRFSLVLLVSVPFFVSSFAFEKHWLPDLEWRSPGNWENGLLPELDAHVIFPLATRHAVGLTKFDQIRLSRIDLPREGSLVLSRDGVLEMTDSTKSKARVARWAKVGRFFWADPENWSAISAAAPHLERVPCSNDDVVLPSSDHTMNIILPIMDVQVRSIRLENRSEPLPDYEWENSESRREFSQGRLTVGISQLSCGRCQCQDNYKDYLEEICAIERPKCGFTYCEYPLRVDGHCCFYCGARITLPKSLSLTVIRSTVDEALQGYEREVSWYVRRAPNENIEILVKEIRDYTGVESLEASDRLQRVLRGDGIEILAAETAGAAVVDARLAVALGSFFGAPLVVLSLLLLAFSYFGYTFRQLFSSCGEAWSSIREGVRSEKPKSGKPFSFARFENISEGNVEIAGTAEPTGQSAGQDVGDAEEESTGGRFENPLYRSKRGKKHDEPTDLDTDVPLSLSTLKDTVASSVEEIEMNIE